MHHSRHMDGNGCMSMPAKINHQAIPFNFLKRYTRNFVAKRDSTEYIHDIQLAPDNSKVNRNREGADTCKVPITKNGLIIEKSEK